MHYNFVMVGAHDGKKLLKHIKRLSTERVLLVEPVPFLFRRLSETVKGLPNITLANVCVSLTDGPVAFTAPTETATTLHHMHDQVGSLRPDFALTLDPRMADHLETLQAQGKTFRTLLDEHDITSIRILMTDTEGMDCELLQTFPLERVRPERIIFEYMHSDGLLRVGPKLARFLIFLDEKGYDVRSIDRENMRATRRR